MVRCLTEQDATMWADGGGKARGAGTQPRHGRMAVAQFVLASTRCPAPNYHADIAEVNGQPAAILRIGEKPLVVIAIQVDSEHVREIRVIGNPDKLRWV